MNMTIQKDVEFVKESLSLGQLTTIIGIKIVLNILKPCLRIRGLRPMLEEKPNIKFKSL